METGNIRTDRGRKHLYLLDEAMVLFSHDVSQSETIKALLTSLDAREKEAKAHSLRVMEYTVYLSRQIGVPKKDLPQIAWGALLHDIGKIGIPDSILKKDDGLTRDEWHTMRQHTIIGYRILEPVTSLSIARDIVLCHHEHYDGSGYPGGIRGTDIPLGARIFTVCDALDAITSPRCYRSSHSFEWGINEIKKGRGSRYDPDIIDQFMGIPLPVWKVIRTRTEHQVESNDSISLIPSGSKI